jgi:glutamyl-tRNA synthetase
VDPFSSVRVAGTSGRVAGPTSCSILASAMTVLYNLASVVDDHDMRITHVIRAEEHLSNTPRQIFIARGLGYELPEYAHVPFVAEPGSKNKLSKRKIAQYLKNPYFKKVYEHGQAIARALGLQTSADTFNPVIVDFYQQVGYLPDAILNYLVLLGWSLDDKAEFFTTKEMIELFSLERVNKAPASFDPEKEKKIRGTNNQASRKIRDRPSTVSARHCQRFALVKA